MLLKERCCKTYKKTLKTPKRKLHSFQSKKKKQCTRFAEIELSFSSALHLTQHYKTCNTYLKTEGELQILLEYHRGA